MREAVSLWHVHTIHLPNVIQYLRGDSLSLSEKNPTLWSIVFEEISSESSLIRSILYNPFILSLSLFLPFFFFFFCLVDEKLKQKEKEKEKSDFLFLFLLCFVIWNRKNHLHETTKLVDSHSYAWKTKKGVRFRIFKASRLKLLTPFPFLSFSFTFSAAKQHSQQQFNSSLYICVLIWIEIMFILYKYWYCSTCCMKAAINIIMMLGVIRRRVASGGSSASVN